MLILTRKIKESLVIGDDMIEVIVLGTRNNEVRLGIQAPKNVLIHRKECLRKNRHPHGEVAESGE